ncbi:MAG TPA: hypothetical protein VFW00_03565, partial [Rhodocyclaceae bacterium]|nr:hypothetical protein [Rhodocyclaceae bacterium]
DGRRDERILFAAITRPQMLEPWLQALRTQEAAVSAIYTVPLLTQQLLSGMRPGSPRGLILALSSAGIRQIYFEEGKLRFSRLSPRPETPFSHWAPDCLREAQKTYQYLSAQRWLARGSRLPVWIVLHEKDRASVMGELVSTDSLEFHTVDLLVLAQRFGMREHLASSDCRPLLMRMALRERRAPQLAPKIDRYFFRLWQARTAILTTGVLSFTLCTLVAIKYHLDARNRQQEAAQTRLDTQFETSRYQQLIASLPAMPTSLDTLHDVVNGFERTAQARTDPQLALEKLSHALDRFPDIEVNRIDWFEGNGQDGAGSNAPTNVASDAARNATTSQPATKQTIQLDAQLPEAAAADPRAAIARIRDFADELRKQSGGEVSLIKQPFDIGSDKTLKSDTETVRKHPEFQLRLTLSDTAP